MDLSEFENDPRLFLFTSLTSGSSHIITATSRLETILKANKIAFQAIDTATDEKARRLWQRRARDTKLPGLVKDGFVIGGLEEIEEWNEFGELKENIGTVPASSAASPGGRQGVNIRPLAPGSPPEAERDIIMPHPAASPTASALVDESSRIALPGAAEIAARNKSKSAPPDPNLEELGSIAPAPTEKERSVSASNDVDELAPGSDISGSAGRTHRGSEVKDAPLSEIQKIENENALKEEIHEDEAVDDLEENVKHVTFHESPEKTQNQDAKEGSAASKSVDD